MLKHILSQLVEKTVLCAWESCEHYGCSFGFNSQLQRKSCIFGWFGYLVVMVIRHLYHLMKTKTKTKNKIETPTSQAPTPPWKEPVHISFSRTRPLKYLLHSLLLSTGTWATLRTVSSPVPWNTQGGTSKRLMWWTRRWQRRQVDRWSALLLTGVLAEVQASKSFS